MSRWQTLPRKRHREEGHHGGKIWYVFNKDSIGTEGLRLQCRNTRGRIYEEHATHGYGANVLRLSGTMAVQISGKEYTAGLARLSLFRARRSTSIANVGNDNLVFLTINVAIRSGEVPPIP